MAGKPGKGGSDEHAAMLQQEIATEIVDPARVRVEMLMQGRSQKVVLTRMPRRAAITRLLASLVLLTTAIPTLAADYTLFESDPVRPMAMSADGKTLYAANIPDGRLESSTSRPTA